MNFRAVSVIANELGSEAQIGRTADLDARRAERSSEGFGPPESIQSNICINIGLDCFADARNDGIFVSHWLTAASPPSAIEFKKEQGQPAAGVANASVVRDKKDKNKDSDKAVAVGALLDPSGPALMRPPPPTATRGNIEVKLIAED